MTDAELIAKVAELEGWERRDPNDMIVYMTKVGIYDLPMADETEIFADGTLALIEKLLKAGCDIFGNSTGSLYWVADANDNAVSDPELWRAVAKARVSTVMQGDE